MNDKLTLEYLDKHMVNIHDWESFARGFSGRVLGEVKDKLMTGESQGVDSVDLLVPVTVKSNMLGCISICVYGICIHIPV